MTSRRGLLRWLAIAPGLALTSRPASASVLSPGFSPRATPYRLVRRVERDLRDRTRLVVERTWSIRFLPLEQGYRVDGRQTGIGVDAPAALDFLVRIERERIEEAMFPLLLDSRGLAAGGACVHTDAALAKAVGEVRSRLNRILIDGDERAQAARFLTHLQRAGENALSAWPAALFAPGHIDMVEQRTVPLPDGLPGKVAVHTVASSNRTTGLMEHFQRTVETRIAGGTRTGLERFTLTPET